MQVRKVNSKVRNKHKIGLGRPRAKNELGLRNALEAAASVGAAEPEELSKNDRILRDFFWSPPRVQPSASVHRLPAPAAEPGASPRIAKKTD